MKSRMLRGLLPYNKNPEGSAAGGKGPRRRRVVDYREGKRKARRVGEKTSTSAGPDGKPASAPLLPAPAALEPAPAPAFVHDSGPSAFTSEGQSALSSSAPYPWHHPRKGSRGMVGRAQSLRSKRTALSSSLRGRTVKTYTATKSEKYLEQAEKLDAQEKRSAESPAQVGRENGPSVSGETAAGSNGIINVLTYLRFALASSTPGRLAGLQRCTGYASLFTIGRVLFHNRASRACKYSSQWQRFFSCAGWRARQKSHAGLSTCA